MEKKYYLLFKARSEKMGTPVNIDNGPARIKLNPVAKPQDSTPTCIETERRKFSEIPPLAQPPNHCTVDAVPEDARREEKQFGPLKLIGLKFEETHLKKRKHNILETYWELSENEIEQDFMIVERLLLQGKDKESMWDADHDGCDWLWPTSRWKKGIIYYDKFLMRPPLRKDFIPGVYDLVIGIANIRTNEQYIEKLDVTVRADGE